MAATIALKLDNLPKYSWEEVQKHYTRDDCWVVIEKIINGHRRGIILDITQWAPKHPGGSIIYDGAGGDCSVMFWCYHPISFIDNSNSYFNKYAIGEVEDYVGVYNVDSPIFRALKTRVEKQITREERCYDPRLYFKSVLIIAVFVAMFYLGWYKGSTPAVIIMGLFMGLSYSNIMHDGIHTSYSKYPVICEMAAWTFNALGANSLSYRRVHAFGHHAYTSHDQYDTSLPRSSPYVKLHDKLPVKWFQRFQHIYVWIAYLTGGLHFWCGDFWEMAHFWNYPVRKSNTTYTQWLFVLSGKAVFCYWYLYLPFTWHSWQTALLHCAIAEAGQSFIGIIFFAVNHWTDKAAVISEEDMKKYTKDWVTLQVISSTNFSRKSSVWAFICGSLNLQIEHHLFPQVVHTRAGDVSDTIRETCIEFGLDYDAQCYESFTAAIIGLCNFIRNVGQQIPLKPFPQVSDPMPLKKHEEVAVAPEGITRRRHA